MRTKISASIINRLAVLTAIALLLFASLPAAVSASTTPAFTPSAAESELVRLFNLERTRNSLPTLAIDPFLASVARDGNIACPGNPSLVMAGRVGDLAANWTPSSSADPHALRLCPTKRVFDVMYGQWGYTGAAGEIFGWDQGYSMSPMTYPSDCGIEGLTGPCYDSAPGLVSVAATGFMESPGHRAIVLGNYDRFGCGAAETADGSAYFVCIFSLGGGTAVADPSPTPSPSASPTPTPAPSVSPSPSASPTPSPTPSPSASPTPSPSPSASPTPAPVSVAKPSDRTPPTVRARSYWHSGRRIRTSATFADAGGLKTICLSIDGRSRGCWSAAGRKSFGKTWYGYLSRGRHVVTWSARDMSGHLRTTSFIIRLS